MQSLSVKILFFRFLKAGLLAGCRAKSVQDNIIVDPQFFCQNRPYHHSRRKNDNIIRRNNIPLHNPSDAHRSCPDVPPYSGILPDNNASLGLHVAVYIAIYPQKPRHRYIPRYQCSRPYNGIDRNIIDKVFAILLFCVGSFYIQIFNRIYDIGTDMHFIM